MGRREHWNIKNNTLKKKQYNESSGSEAFFVYVCICLGMCVYMYIARVGLSVVVCVYVCVSMIKIQKGLVVDFSGHSRSKQRK